MGKSSWSVTDPVPGPSRCVAAPQGRARAPGLLDAGVRRPDAGGARVPAGD